MSELKFSDLASSTVIYLDDLEGKAIESLGFDLDGAMLTPDCPCDGLSSNWFLVVLVEPGTIHGVCQGCGAIRSFKLSRRTVQ